MSLSEIQLNTGLAERLKRMICSGRIFHGYIFEGAGKDTETLVEDFAAAALCEKGSGEACGECVSCRKIRSGNSEDIIRSGEGNSIKDKDIENLISRVMKKSYTGRRMFMIIRQAETMTLRAQNRLLKTLEEPPTGVTIMLLTENSEGLAETIRSRCQHFRLSVGAVERELLEDDGFEQKAVSAAVNIIYGKPFYELWKDIEFFSSDKKNAEAFVGIAENFYRDIMISEWDVYEKLIINKKRMDIIKECSRRFSADQMAEAIECAETAAKDIERNVGAGRALKYMIFNIQKKLSGDVF
ncbi:MAG: hypothetical protein HFE90_09455 [Firmicutes bacterium]|nr:hypothetical protein [Bacillota bacterium]